jgi:hypothetical protein
MAIAAERASEKLVARTGVSGDLKLLSNEQVENVGSPLSVFFQ